MDSPGRSWNYMKREVDENPDVSVDKAVDDEEQEGSDKKKHRSSKSKKPSNIEEAEGLDNSGRKRSYCEKNETRKRSGYSSRAGSDEEDYDKRKELRSKQLKKKQEESALEKLSSWYQDGELEGKDGRGKPGRHGRTDESERRKMPLMLSEHDSSLSRTKSKEERSHDKEFEKTTDRESRYLDRMEMNQEKSHRPSDQAKNSTRRWDESNTDRKAEDSHYEKADMISGKASDLNQESVAERSMSTRNQVLGSNSDKGIKFNDREERRVDADRCKSKGKAEALEEDRRTSSSTREGRSGKEKYEKQRHQRTTDQDATESREMTSHIEEVGSAWARDKSVREVEHTSQSKTPERSGRHHQESDLSEMSYERSIDFRSKELEKDIHKDDSWKDSSRDRESSKENWKKRQPSSSDKDSQDVDIVYDRGRERDTSRYGCERTDNERPRGRSGNRKDGSRGEAVKTSSKFGISNENYDVIEIQTKPLDYGRAESGSNFTSRTEVVRQSDIKAPSNDGEWNLWEDRAQRTDIYGSGQSGDDSREGYMGDGTPLQDQNSWRDDSDFQGMKGRGQKGDMSSHSAGGQTSSTGSQPPYGNQDGGSYNRASQQGVKGGRLGRGGRGRPAGRDNQQVGLPLPIMGSPFGPLGRPPPGPMQPLTPGMSPAPGPQMSPGVFMPPFSPIVWPGARGVDMSILAVPPSLSPVPPGPSNARFPPHMGTPSNQAMYFNQSGPGRGVPPSISGTGFNAVGPIGRGTPPDKNSGAWLPPRSSGPPGKAPSRGEQNDYSQNFVDTGMRPQNFIRELELTNIVEDYPKLRELIQKKDEIVANSASAPMYHKCDMREFDLSPEFFGTKFDVILVDPPWEEYVHRAPGVADHMEYWTFEEILNLKIEAIADTPSFIFLWVGDGVGLEQGRQCLKKWGFRRCEDICWVKTNKSNATPGLRHDSHTLFQHSKEHCLMGIKGTVRRSTDGHIIHANIDTDVIIAEEPSYGSTQKPEDMYRIVEHFSLGRRRLELFGEDHNIRSGWVTVGNGLSSSNFNAEAYLRNFADKDGKVWQGGGGRNPPPEAPHLVVTTPDIEALRPKSPMKNQQQLQHQSSSISLTANSSNRRTTGNSPQNPNALGMNQESSSSNPSTPALWASSMENFKGREHGNMPLEDNMYGYSGYATVNYRDFDSHIALNFL